MAEVINGKAEVADFLIGLRRNESEEEWCIADKPELALILQELFKRMQEITANRSENIKRSKIKCAKKLFASINSGTVRYDVADTYQHLMDIMSR